MKSPSVAVFISGGVTIPHTSKAREGPTKHRLAADPARGPVVTKIFLWRAIDRLGYSTSEHGAHLRFALVRDVHAVRAPLLRPCP